MSAAERIPPPPPSRGDAESPAPPPPARIIPPDDLGLPGPRRPDAEQPARAPGLAAGIAPWAPLVAAGNSPTPDASASELWTLQVDGGRRFVLDGRPVLIGRDPTARAGEQEIVVNDPGRTVSKHHARLEIIADRCWITDLDSVNGVLIVDSAGSRRVLRGETAAIDGDFVLGNVTMRIVRPS